MPPYRRRVGGSWQSLTEITNGSSNLAPAITDPNVSVSGDGEAHFAWSTRADDPNVQDGVRYQKGLDGVVETVSAGGGGSVLMVVDSRDQPHIVWRHVGNSHSYAARLNNPSIQYDPQQPWPSRQEPASVVPDVFAAPQDIDINENDNVYLLNKSSIYTRMIEHNLGEQYSFVMFGVGPNTSANVANGNVLATFPLFSSQGAGFATSVSLSYTSGQWDSSVVSQGWTHNYHMYLTDSWTGVENVSAVDTLPPPPPLFDTITLHFGDGRTVVFQWVETDTDGLPVEAHIANDEFGYFSRIDRVTTALDTEYVTTKFGVKYTFRSDGKLREIKDTNNNTLTLDYNEDANPACEVRGWKKITWTFRVSVFAA